MPTSARQIASVLIKSFESGGKCLACGNGGSASQASHFVGELMCTFENKNRDPLPAIALADCVPALTAWSNDFTYETYFERAVKALGKPEDVLVVFSTSGKSKNCLLAAKAARDIGMAVIDLPRKGETTASTQEEHLKIIHGVCRLIDKHYT